MDRTQLLKHFDTLAETPEAVAKLRILVLDLAVSGRLLGSSAQKKFEKQNLGSVIQLISGQHLTQEDYNEDGEGIPYLTGPADFGPRFPKASRWTTTPKVTASKGDILLTVKGAGVGKTNVVIEKEMAISRQLMAVRPKGIDADFVELSLRAAFAAFQAASNGIAIPGISRDDVLKHDIWFSPLAEQRRIVAKVEELLALCDELEARQTAACEHRTRLVRSALDHLTTANGARAVPARSTSNEASGLDNLTAPQRSQPLRTGTVRAPQDDFRRHAAFVLNAFPALTAAPEDVPALRQAILSLAVQGHIVPQNPREGMGDDTVKNVLKERGLKSSTLENASEDLPKLPASWAAVAMAEIFEVVGGIQKTPLRAPRHNAFPYLRVANVQRGRLNLEDVQKFELLDGELDRWRLEPKDVLLVEGNGSEDEIGRCAQWQGEIRDCVHQNHIIRCRPFGHDAKFALLFLNSPVGIAEMKRRAITTSGLFSLSVGKIRSLTVPFPPLAEQQRIVAKVDELLRWCDALEARLTAAQTTATHLLDATLHQILAA